MRGEAIYPTVSPSMSPSLPSRSETTSLIYEVIFRQELRNEHDGRNPSLNCTARARNAQRPERLAPIPPSVTLTSRNRSKTLPSQQPGSREAAAQNQFSRRKRRANRSLLLHCALPSAICYAAALWLRAKIFHRLRVCLSRA
jgi:hypothetical protein